MAALTRVLLSSQPTGMLRTLTNSRRGPWPSVSGPVSLLLFLLTLAAAMLAALRVALVRKVKACGSCRGYGIARCRLCEGAGRVDWAAKMSHYDCCPLCHNKRFVVCSECGGFYHRPLFVHMRRRTSKDASDAVGAAPAGAAARSSVPAELFGEGKLSLAVD